MKQITLTITSRDYTITLDDEFAEVFKRDWQKFMGGQRFLEPKDLINAFIEKCHEVYDNEKTIRKITKGVDNALRKKEKI